MWVAKFKINGEKALIGRICKELSVCANGHIISTKWIDQTIYLNFALFIFSNEKTVQEFVKRLRASPRIVRLEQKEGLIIGLLKEPENTDNVYESSIIYVKPVVFEKNGEEIWHVASWEKKDVMKFAQFMETKYGGKLLKLQQEEISNFSIITLNPELTLPQKRAIQIAIENGYYEVPRRSELKHLAKISGISYSTYQMHLRKAERKLIPFFFERAKGDICR